MPVIIGPQWDFEVNAAIPLADRYQISLISPHVAFDSIVEQEQSSPYIYTTFPSIATHIAAIKEFLSQNKIETAVILAVNNDWGHAHVKAYEQATKENNTKVLRTFKLEKTDGNDPRPEVSLINNLKPDAILLALNQADNVSFTRRYREFGLRAKVLGNENLFPSVSKGSLKEAEGFYFFESDQPDTNFTAKFKQQYGVEPGDIGAETGYDAIYLVVQVIKNMGSSERTAINSGLSKISSYQGVSGLFDFASQHYPLFRKTTLNVIKNGQVLRVN